MNPSENAQGNKYETSVNRSILNTSRFPPETYQTIFDRLLGAWKATGASFDSKIYKDMVVFANVNPSFKSQVPLPTDQQPTPRTPWVDASLDTEVPPEIPEALQKRFNRLVFNWKSTIRSTAGCGSHGKGYVDNAYKDIVDFANTNPVLKPQVPPPYRVRDDGTVGVSSGMAAGFSRW
jgi:hypothetical protein